jgi:hypothetical protein
MVSMKRALAGVALLGIASTHRQQQEAPVHDRRLRKLQLTRIPVFISSLNIISRHSTEHKERTALPHDTPQGPSSPSQADSEQLELHTVLLNTMLRAFIEHAGRESAMHLLEIGADRAPIPETCAVIRVGQFPRRVPVNGTWHTWRVRVCVMILVCV